MFLCLGSCLQKLCDLRIEDIVWRSSSNRPKLVCLHRYLISSLILVLWHLDCFWLRLEFGQLLIRLYVFFYFSWRFFIVVSCVIILGLLYIAFINKPVKTTPPSHYCYQLRTGLFSYRLLQSTIVPVKLYSDAVPLEVRTLKMDTRHALATPEHHHEIEQWKWTLKCKWWTRNTELWTMNSEHEHEHWTLNPEHWTLMTEHWTWTLNIKFEHWKLNLNIVFEHWSWTLNSEMWTLNLINEHLNSEHLNIEQWTFKHLNSDHWTVNSDHLNSEHLNVKLWILNYEHWTVNMCLWTLTMNIGLMIVNFDSNYEWIVYVTTDWIEL